MTAPVTPGTNPGTLLVRGADAGARALLQPGTVVSAVVRRDGGDGALVARLAQLSLPLPRGADVAPGDVVRFQVAAAREGLALRLLAEPPSASAPRSPEQAVQLRDMPRQLSAAEALRGLPTLTRGNPGESSTTATLPGPARDALAGLLARLPAAESAMSAEGVRRVLRDSGTLFEPLLTRLPPEQIAPLMQRDLKAQLAGAAARLRASAPTTPAPGADSTPTAAPALPLTLDPSRALEGLIARINLLQTSSQQPEGRVDLAFEIPLRQGEDIDALELRLREEEANAQAASSNSGWQVDLRLRFADGDAVEARVRLDGAEQVSVTWRARNDVTARRLEGALPQLEAMLERSGLTVAHLGLRAGDVPTGHPALERASRPGAALHERA